MTKILIDEAVLRQALEALATAWTYDEDNADGYYFGAAEALRQALSNAALDKMAENARELGLSYEQPPVPWSQELEAVWAESDDQPAPAPAPAPAQETVVCKDCGAAIKNGKVKCVRGRNCWVGRQPTPAQPDPDELTIAYMSGLHAGKKIGAKEGRNKLATWMMQCGFATGHGDTLEELLYELDTEVEDRLAAAREKGGDV